MASRLLVVDDDLDTSVHLKTLLSKEGYEVDVAFDGDEALVKLKSYDPDVIILDLMMPKMNGFDVLKEVREKHKDKWRPVIIISAKTELESLKTCYELEADHYLSKPFTIEDLLRAVKVMISLIPARLQ